MRKRILTSLCLLALCLSLIGSFCAYAASLGVDVQTSLTLRYQKDGKTFPNLEIGIYRVAEAKSDGTFQLIAPFSGYPVSIQHVTSQSQWQNVATTLSSYITAKDVCYSKTAFHTALPSKKRTVYFGVVLDPTYVYHSAYV